MPRLLTEADARRALEIIDDFGRLILADHRPNVKEQLKDAYPVPFTELRCLLSAVLPPPAPEPVPQMVESTIEERLAAIEAKLNLSKFHFAECKWVKSEPLAARGTP